MTNTDLEGFYYRRVFHGDEVIECSVLEEPELTTGNMLRQKVVRNRVTRRDKKR